jgi:hypothetical protein
MMNRRSAIALLIAALLVPSSLSAYWLEKTWERTFAVEGDARFALSNVNGRIDVSSWDKGEIAINAEITIKAPSKSKAEELYEKMRFIVEEQGDYVGVEADLPRIRQVGFHFGEHTSISIRYDVKVPRRVSLDVKNVNGDVEAEGIRGTFDIETVNGDIVLRSMEGEGEAMTVNGGIICSIKQFPRDGQLDIKTTNGGVSLSLPENVSSSLDAKTFNGHIDIDIALKKSIKVKRTRVSGMLGDGEGSIRVRTTNGRISIDEI